MLGKLITIGFFFMSLLVSCQTPIGADDDDPEQPSPDFGALHPVLKEGMITA